MPKLVELSTVVPAATVPVVMLTPLTQDAICAGDDPIMFVRADVKYSTSVLPSVLCLNPSEGLHSNINQVIGERLVIVIGLVKGVSG
jgi:hypothetical protein